MVTFSFGAGLSGVIFTKIFSGEAADASNTNTAPNTRKIPVKHNEVASFPKFISLNCIIFALLWGLGLSLRHFLFVPQLFIGQYLRRVRGDNLIFGIGSDDFYGYVFQSGEE